MKPDVLTSTAGPGLAEQRSSAPELSIDGIVLGKDVLELISSAMYIDPMTVYREYIQNAADSVDVAKQQGLLNRDEPGHVDISFDAASRTVRIRDNGAGIAGADFFTRLSAIGASAKRGTDARGFRGVGRLAGLGYAQELIFRSRVEGEDGVSELRWDCKKLKSALRSTDYEGGVGALVSHIVTAERIDSEGYPERFFEVELRGIVRLRTDKLLTPVAVTQYLSQVAPVPFAPEFALGAEITAALKCAFDPGELHIHVDGSETPVYRPHRNSFDAGGGNLIPLEEVEITEIPDMDGGCAAIAWVIHHPYQGAIPGGILIKGLRLRTGNLQVGDNAVLDELFTEPRFNAWSVGEVHVLDRRILPNGRRDNFEQNAHLNNLLNQLGPTAREISRRCRSNSIKRNWLRKFELYGLAVRDAINLTKQGGVSAYDRDKVADSAMADVREMERIATMGILEVEAESLSAMATSLNEELISGLEGRDAKRSPMSRLSTEKREMYEHLFGLIYECSTNRVAAKKLIGRIMQRVV